MISAYLDNAPLTFRSLSLFTDVKIFYNGKWSETRRGYFSYIFSIYIDYLLLQLRNSGYGFHLNGVYMEALSLMPMT